MLVHYPWRGCLLDCHTVEPSACLSACCCCCLAGCHLPAYATPPPPPQPPPPSTRDHPLRKGGPLQYPAPAPVVRVGRGGGKERLSATTTWTTTTATTKVVSVSGRGACRYCGRLRKDTRRLVQHRRVAPH